MPSSHPFASGRQAMAPDPRLLLYPIIACDLFFFAEFITGMPASTERAYVSSGKEPSLASFTNQCERLNCWLLVSTNQLISTPFEPKFQLFSCSAPGLFSASFCLFGFYLRQEVSLLYPWMVAQDTNRRERDHIFLPLCDIRQVDEKP